MHSAGFLRTFYPGDAIEGLSTGTLNTAESPYPVVKWSLPSPALISPGGSLASAWRRILQLSMISRRRAPARGRARRHPAGRARQIPFRRRPHTARSGEYPEAGPRSVLSVPRRRRKSPVLLSVHRRPWCADGTILLEVRMGMTALVISPSRASTILKMACGSSMSRLTPPTRFIE